MSELARQEARGVLHEGPAANIIERLRGLLAKASPAPWIDPPSRETPPGAYCPYLASKDGDGEVLVGRFDYCSEFDKPLIAALRNEAPALLDEIEQLRGVAAELLVALKDISRHLGAQKAVTGKGFSLLVERSHTKARAVIAKAEGLAEGQPDREAGGTT